MKNVHFLLLTVVFFVSNANSQSVKDLFTKSATPVYWLGIDFSHVKLIGEFAQFSEWGEAGAEAVRDKYFPAWNELIIREYTKYDVGTMIRKEDVSLKINAIAEVNKNAPIENMVDLSDPNYTEADIRSWVSRYPLENKEGLGVLFIAESLNKLREYGKYHIVVINMSTKEVLIHEVMKGRPGGIGLRNYWARSFCEVMNEIRDYRFREWKKKYGKRG